MNANDRPVNGPDGMYGTVNVTCWPSSEEPDCDVNLRLPDGLHVTLASDLLIEQKDGSFYLPLSREELAALPMSDRPAPGTNDCWPCEEQQRAEAASADGAAQDDCSASRRSISSLSSER